MNASTSGSASRNSLENRCDMQPLTIGFWSDRLFKPRCWCASRIASIDSSLAESMNAQVLTTRTSASSRRDVISIPRCKTLPSMISASTRFLAQPRLIMPTFVARCRRVNGSSFATETPKAFGAKPRELTTSLIDRHVFVVLFQRFAVFRDLNGVRIQNTNRDVLAAKFNRTVSRRNPALERGLALFITHNNPHVRSFEWANSDAILFARLCGRRIRRRLCFGQVFPSHGLGATHLRFGRSGRRSSQGLPSFRWC